MSKIFDCARLYKENFSGRNISLAYVGCNGISIIETAFSASNFKHLTGIYVNGLSNREFFSKAVDKRLREEDFDFGKNDMSGLKLSVLPELLNDPASSLKMIGEYDANSKQNLITEKIAGGVNACMGLVKNASSVYVPNTILADDMRHLVIRTYCVVAIWRKKRIETWYTEELCADFDKIEKHNLILEYISQKAKRFRQG